MKNYEVMHFDVRYSLVRNSIFCCSIFDIPKRRQSLLLVRQVPTNAHE